MAIQWTNFTKCMLIQYNALKIIIKHFQMKPTR